MKTKTKTTTKTAAAATYEVVKNGPREYEKESRTVNRIYTGMITTWDVVNTATCELVSEHRTRREARAALDALLAKQTTPAVETCWCGCGSTQPHQEASDECGSTIDDEPSTADDKPKRTATITLSTHALDIAGLDDLARFTDIERAPGSRVTRCTGTLDALISLVTELCDRATEGADGFAHSAADKRVLRRAVASAVRQGVTPRGEPLKDMDGTYYHAPADSDEPSGYKPEAAALYDGTPSSGSLQRSTPPAATKRVRDLTAGDVVAQPVYAGSEKFPLTVSAVCPAKRAGYVIVEGTDAAGRRVQVPFGHRDNVVALATELPFINGVRLRKGRELTERGDYGVKRQLRTTSLSPAVYWSRNHNSYVAVRNDDGTYRVLSINGIGEIRWSLDPANDRWQCDNDGAAAIQYFFEKENA